VRVAFRTFVARSGAKILVGKGAADNDTLTLHVAKPHDLWLHAKDRAGAHVVVPLGKGKSCPAEDLVDAAHLAAHFSDARDEKAVDIQYLPRRYVRKPKGSAPGAVVVDREKVLPLRFDSALLRRLLEREQT
jgi:predicted ribosome quality control (RQC) complex YloA/Tae2 family protein